jgi:hypothetical protein
MNITSAQYALTYYHDENEVLQSKNGGIYATIDGEEVTVPLDPANRHYAEIMRQVEAGDLTIQDADD